MLLQLKVHLFNASTLCFWSGKSRIYPCDTVIVEKLFKTSLMSLFEMYLHVLKSSIKISAEIVVAYWALKSHSVIASTTVKSVTGGGIAVKVRFYCRSRIITVCISQWLRSFVHPFLHWQNRSIYSLYLSLHYWHRDW